MQLQEAETLKAIAFEDLVRAREDRDKVVSISLKFHNFVGHPGDIINKAWLYDESACEPGASSALKVIRCLVDYNAKMEKLLREMQTLLQSAEQQLATPQPTTQQPAPESTEQPTPAPVTTPPTQLEEPVAPTGTVDSTLQKPISESLNIEDIASLEQWATGGLRDMATPTTGSQGMTVLVTRSTPRFVTRSQLRGSGSVQTNLFGELRISMGEVVRRRVREKRVREKKAREEEPAAESRSSSKGKKIWSLSTATAWRRRGRKPLLNRNRMTTRNRHHLPRFIGQ